MKFSIILRAYNVAEVVSKSIESVVCQTYKNWELIIVNDGSTDQTAQIIKQCADKDNRIRVIHQENKGCLYEAHFLKEHQGMVSVISSQACSFPEDIRWLSSLAHLNTDYHGKV